MIEGAVPTGIHVQVMQVVGGVSSVFYTVAVPTRVKIITRKMVPIC